MPEQLFQKKSGLPRVVTFGEQRVRYLPPGGGLCPPLDPLSAKLFSKELPDGKQALRDYQQNSDPGPVKARSPKVTFFKKGLPKISAQLFPKELDTSRFVKSDQSIEVVEVEVEIEEKPLLPFRGLSYQMRPRCHKCLGGLAKDPFYCPCAECL
jgi:hypothetical protein